jgi:hypothetical protein
MSRFSSRLLSVFAALVLAACGGGSGGSSAAISRALSGAVHGGQFPVSGSTVTLYQAGIAPSGSAVLASTTTDSNGDFSFASVSCPRPYTPTYIVAPTTAPST